MNSSCVSILAFLALFKGAGAEDDKVTYGADIVRARFDSLVMDVRASGNKRSISDQLFFFFVTL